MLGPAEPLGLRKLAVIEWPLSVPFGPGEWTLASVHPHGPPRKVMELIVALI